MVYDENLTNDLNIRDFRDLCKAIGGGSGKNKSTRERFYYTAKLGEVVNKYNVKYFGRQKAINYTYTAMFICPKCDELFRANIKSIINNKIKCCKGCK